MPANYWYSNYDSLRSQITKLQTKLKERCKELNVSEDDILRDFSSEFISRAVHESNWQEGLELDAGKTQKLADMAFDEIGEINGPHLDMTKLLKFHRDAVLKLKKKHASEEEIGAYNLARAHHAIKWIANDISNRHIASIVHVFDQLKDVIKKAAEKATPEDLIKIEKGIAAVKYLREDTSPLTIPHTSISSNVGEMICELSSLDLDSLITPVKPDYIHFLHRLVLMGIMPADQNGKYRKKAVHVGNSELFFPAASAVPQMMREFCKKFPPLLAALVKYDVIMAAAKASHNFVVIHPYSDGNGRVSRLIMNLVLQIHYPPVYLKADKKGRHRYSQALRKADKGNFEPLAALIAMSLIEIYHKVLRSLGVTNLE